jgi:hypothetical protein
LAISRTQFRNEGRTSARVDRPFQIPYRSLTPQAAECANLLVPVCLSASKVGFCPLRLESTWMALGQAAGSAGVLAAEADTPVQGLETRRLQDLLIAAGVAL